jgi:hypothetical protein
MPAAAHLLVPTSRATESFCRADIHGRCSCCSWPNIQADNCRLAECAELALLGLAVLYSITVQADDTGQVEVLLARTMQAIV